MSQKNHNDALKTRLDFAIAAADAAGELVLRYFQSSQTELGAELKKDRSIVTHADREAELLIREKLAQRFPDDGIIGEEHGVKAGKNGFTWILDPIDGTQAFARGVSLFGTLIGIECDGAPDVGVIGLPALGEMVYAARGMGCHWRRGTSTTAARVSDVASLDKAMFCTTWMQSFKERDCVSLFQRLTDATAVFRGWGDCYGYALVATGRAEIMVDPVLAVWDAAPLLVVLEEAGGRYTSFDGSRDIRAGTGIATNGRLHDAVLKLI